MAAEGNSSQRAAGLLEFLKEIICQAPEFSNDDEINIRITCSYVFELAPNLMPSKTPVLFAPNVSLSTQKETFEKELNQLVSDLKSRLMEFLSNSIRYNELGEFEFEIVVISDQKSMDESSRYVGVYPIF